MADRLRDLIEDALAHLHQASRCLQAANEGAPALVSLLLVPMIGNVTLQASDLEAVRDAAAETPPRVPDDIAGELLAALQAIIEADGSEGAAAGGFIPKAPTREHQQRVMAAWQKAHAAIAKATGSAS